MGMENFLYNKPGSLIGYPHIRDSSVSEITAHLIAWGEIVSGNGILLGGFLGIKAPVAGNSNTRSIRCPSDGYNDRGYC